MPVMTEIEPVALATDEPELPGLYPIREVARLTGVNPVTLRAWERRYGLIQPTRTETGHRLYTMSDIEAVRQVMGWLERGVAVSKVAELLARPATAENMPREALADEYAQWQSRVQGALSAFNEIELDRLYGQIFSSYPLDIVFQRIFMPLWQQLLKVQDEFGRTSEWLLLDGFLRGRVQQRLHLQPTDARECVLLVGLPELCRELQLLVAGLLLSRNDRAIKVLAIGQPLDELPLIGEKVKPQAVVVFAHHVLSAAHQRRLLRLAQSLDYSLALAGEAANVAQEALAGSSIVCLGSEARLMNQRLDAELREAAVR
ncbi:MerR family transcriptional regulator [Pseudomonas sp. 7P_10.2_Bac1]|uniref:MerR family transcriptional regulator n=1 Tax=Pseudomonas sp. 7P_10.2_Bac1 TaxID=2971614 RepID=UPI0021CAD1A9|nr:MerR family transcriptional regulator [Pseudomonas sp. 7P_10.2_Bac1]MCU1729273.1 MerR family transcriptional regulator [Pseudomonas sp. 7P_10.2_Bac1]